VGGDESRKALSNHRKAGNYEWGKALPSLPTHQFYRKDEVTMEQYKRKTWSFTPGEFLMVILFSLLVGTGLGMFYRIKQIEPQLTIAQTEIKQSHSLIAKDITELDVRLTLLEKKIYGTRVKP